MEQLSHDEAEEVAGKVKENARQKALQEMGLSESDIEEIKSLDEKDDSYIIGEHYREASNEFFRQEVNQNFSRTQKNLDPREIRRIEKDRKRLPEIGKILEDQSLYLGEKGRFIFRWGRGLIGIVISRSFSSEIDKITNRMGEILDELGDDDGKERFEYRQFYSRSLRSRKHWHDQYNRIIPVVADVEVVGHAQNARSILCVVKGIKNVADIRGELTRLEDVLARRKRENEEAKKRQEQRQEKTDKAREIAPELIISVVQKLNLKVGRDLVFKALFEGKVGDIARDRKKETRVTTEFFKRKPFDIETWDIESRDDIPDFYIEPIPKVGVELIQLNKKFGENIRLELELGGYDKEVQSDVNWFLSPLINPILLNNFVEIVWSIQPHIQQDLFIGDEKLAITTETTYTLPDGTVPDWAKDN